MIPIGCRPDALERLEAMGREVGHERFGKSAAPAALEGA